MQNVQESLQKLLLQVGHGSFRRVDCHIHVVDTHRSGIQRWYSQVGDVAAEASGYCIDIRKGKEVDHFKVVYGMA